MIERLAKHMVSWQISQNFLQKEKESLYTYAYELLIGQVINLLIACLLAVIFRDFVTVVVYLAVYIPLRSYAGGHHSDSYTVCMLVSSCLICMVCVLVKVIPVDAIWLINLAITLISGSTIFLLAPIQDFNKPLEWIETNFYRKRSRRILLIELVLMVVCYQVGGRKISLAIALAHLTLSGMLYAGLIKNHFREDNT